MTLFNIEDGTICYEKKKGRKNKILMTKNQFFSLKLTVHAKNLICFGYKIDLMSWVAWLRTHTFASTGGSRLCSRSEGAEGLVWVSRKERRSRLSIRDACLAAFEVLHDHFLHFLGLSLFFVARVLFECRNIFSSVVCLILLLPIASWRAKRGH